MVLDKVLLNVHQFHYGTVFFLNFFCILNIKYILTDCDCCIV